MNCTMCSQGEMSTGSQSERPLERILGEELCCIHSTPSAYAASEFLVNHSWS